MLGARQVVHVRRMRLQRRAVRHERGRERADAADAQPRRRLLAVLVSGRPADRLREQSQQPRPLSGTRHGAVLDRRGRVVPDVAHQRGAREPRSLVAARGWRPLAGRLWRNAEACAHGGHVDSDVAQPASLAAPSGSASATAGCCSAASIARACGGSARLMGGSPTTTARASASASARARSSMYSDARSARVTRCCPGSSVSEPQRLGDGRSRAAERAARRVGLGDSVTLLAGRYSVTIYAQPGAGDPRRCAAARRRRPCDPSRAGTPPCHRRLCRGVVLRQRAAGERALAAARVDRRRGATRSDERPGGDPAAACELARALDSLPRVRTLRCEPQGRP